MPGPRGISRQARHRSGGFTIIELMTVVLIIGVLAAVGAPSLRDLVVSTKVKTAASDLHVHLSSARSEAVKRNAQVDVTPTSTSDWSQGWQIMVGTTVLEAQQPYSSIVFTGPAGSVSYLGNGRVSSTTNVSFTIRSADYSHIQARCVTIDPSGRANVVTDSDSNYANGCN